MNARQESFVREYLVDLNASEAAKRAGYSKKTARTIGSKLLTNVDIADAIAKAQAKRAQKLEVTADRVVAELAKIGFANSGDYFEWGPGGIIVKEKSTLTLEQQAAVAEVSETTTKDGGSIRVKLHDKVAALDKLARHLGLFKDELEAKISGEILVKVERVDSWSMGDADVTAARN